MTTMAICVIADEVLTGKTLDTNSNYLAKKAFYAGFKVTGISVIPDSKSEIEVTIKSMRAQNDLVFTSGGIGPTHDDLTYSSIANAFKTGLNYRPEIGERMKLIAKIDSLNDGQIRMCTVPTSSELIFTKDLWQPIVKIENVYIFPGVPALFHRMVDSWFEQEALKYTQNPMIRVSIRTELKESVIATELTKYQEMAKKHNCSIGSYPKLNIEDGKSSVEISIIGPETSKQEIDKIVDSLCISFKARRYDFQNESPTGVR